MSPISRIIVRNLAVTNVTRVTSNPTTPFPVILNGGKAGVRGPYIKQKAMNAVHKPAQNADTVRGLQPVRSEEEY